VLVPPFGALSERVAASGAGFVMTDDEWTSERAMLARIIAVLDGAHEGTLAAAARRARDVATPSLRDMADATMQVYENALRHATRASKHPAFDAARVRDALGYRAWHPPQIPAAPEPAPSAHAEAVSWITRLARRALAIRHTAVGRALYRMTPRPVVDALKDRLSA
jgi:hypothetical protein